MKKTLSFRLLPQIAFTALGLVSICSAAHAQASNGTDKSLAFALHMDLLSPGLERMSPPRPARGFTERDFTRYRFDGDGSGFFFFAEQVNPEGDLIFGVSVSTRGASRENMLIHQHLRDSRGAASASCWLYPKAKNLPPENAADDSTPFVGLISYAGVCDGRPVEFTLAVSRAPSKAIEEACINEGVALSSKLSSCEAAVADKQTTLAATQSELSKTRSERDQARGQLQKLSSTMSGSVIPYLKRVADTLKDPNNFYRTLRNDAKGVLDASSK